MRCACFLALLETSRDLRTPEECVSPHWCHATVASSLQAPVSMPRASIDDPGPDPVQEAPVRVNMWPAVPNRACSSGATAARSAISCTPNVSKVASAQTTKCTENRSRTVKQSTPSLDSWQFLICPARQSPHNSQTVCSTQSPERRSTSRSTNKLEDSSTIGGERRNHRPRGGIAP